MGPEPLNTDSLNYLRTILIKSLSSENVAHSDLVKVRRYNKNFQKPNVKTDAGINYVMPMLCAVVVGDTDRSFRCSRIVRMVLA